MRPNITRMDFRTLPSTLPLHSPSPDTKSPNCLTPTISPNSLDIKKNLTPIKTVHKQNFPKTALNEQHYQYRNYESLGSNNHPNASTSSKKDHPLVNIQRYVKIIEEKDETIENLKKIIDTITDHDRSRHHNNDDFQDRGTLKKQIKVLTIQNQKLVEIIQKLTLKQRNNNYQPQQLSIQSYQLTNSEDTQKIYEQEITVKFENYQKQINHLNDTLKRKQQKHSAQLKNLKKQYRLLASNLVNAQQEKKQLEKQNAKLIGILKEKDQVNSRISQFTSNINTSSAHNRSQTFNQQPNQIQHDLQKHNQKSQEKLSLLKIKQQYSANLRVLRSQLEHQIQQAFDLIKLQFSSLGIKVTGMSNRLAALQKIAWAQYHDSHPHDKEQQQPVQLRPLPQRNTKKSEIYIEEAPQSSSSHFRSSDEPQEQDKKYLEQELSSLKIQLEELRFKYEKICIDTSSVSYSKRMHIPPELKEEEHQYKHKYQLLLGSSEIKDIEIRKKDKQIDMLYQQIRVMQEKNYEKHAEGITESRTENRTENITRSQGRAHVEFNQDYIHLLQEQLATHKQRIADYVQYEKQVESKINQLVSNYEKQLSVYKAESMGKDIKIKQLTGTVIQLQNKGSEQITVQLKKRKSSEEKLEVAKAELRQSEQEINQYKQQYRQESQKHQLDRKKFEAERKQYQQIIDNLKKQKELAVEQIKGRLQQDNEEYYKTLKQQINKQHLENLSKQKQLSDLKQQISLKEQQLSAKEIQLNNKHYELLNKQEDILRKQIELYDRQENQRKRIQALTQSLNTDKIKQLLTENRQLQLIYFKEKQQLKEPQTPILKLSQKNIKQEQQQSSEKEDQLSPTRLLQQKEQQILSLQTKIVNLNVKLLQQQQLASVYESRYKQSQSKLTKSIRNTQKIEKKYQTIFNQYSKEKQLFCQKYEMLYRKQRQAEVNRRNQILEEVERLDKAIQGASRDTLPSKKFSQESLKQESLNKYYQSAIEVIQSSEQVKYSKVDPQLSIKPQTVDINEFKESAQK